MHIQRKAIRLYRILIDVVFIIASFIISILFPLRPDLVFWGDYTGYILISVLIVWYFSSGASHLYDEFRASDFSYELIAVLKNIFTLFVTAIVTAFILKENQLTRTFIFQFVLLAFSLILMHKILLRKYLFGLRQKGRNLRQLLILGAGSVGRKFVDAVEKNPHFGYRIVGFLDDVKNDSLNGQYLGTIDSLEKVLVEKDVDEVIIALPNYAIKEVEAAVNTCENYTTRVRIIPDYFNFLSSKYSVSTFGSFPMIAVREDKVNEFHWRMLKRGYDFIFTLPAFIFIFSWLFPLIVLAVKLNSKGPAIFKQERWGRGNKKFMTYKFRTMLVDEKDINGLNNFKQASKDDPRITKVGKLLRKTNLDELPQFYNVLKGEMSLVGPRPHPTPLNNASREKIKLYMIRHLVKPGITGWAQVNGFRGETKDHSLMQKRIDYDVWYIENWSPILDIQIIVKTIWNMIKGDPNAY